MSSRPTSSFCSIPWYSIYIHPNGSVRPCCMQSVYYGDTGEGDTIENVWNSDKAKDLRQSFLEGKMPETCSSCAIKEKTIGKSRRTEFNSYVGTNFPEKLTEPLSQAAITDFILLDLSFSNRCNLKCRFCGPMNSTSWFEDAKQLRAQDKNFWGNFMGVDYQPMSQNPQEYIELADRSPSLRRIEIKGGEPFLATEQVPFLRHLVQTKRAQDIGLDYSTNGTVVLPALKELWPHFKYISVCLSAEATGSLYQYIRGGKRSLDEVEKNLEFYRDIPNVKVNLHVTFSSYNLFALPDLHRWYLKIKSQFPFVQKWQLGLVVNPRPLYVGSLPLEIRQAAYQQMQNFDDQVWSAAKAALQIETPREKTLQHFRDFKKYVTDLDQLRGTSFLEVAPEFQQFWDLA